MSQSLLRPRLLATLLCSSVLAPVARAQLPVVADLPSVLSYHTVQVARGVYAFIAPEERTGLQSGNSIAVIGDSAVLIFDTGAIPGTTRRQIAELRKLTSKPVRYVVNSHWHPDHNLANSEYRTAFPEVRFIGTKATQQGIIDRAPVFKEQVKGFATTDSLMRLRLSTGKMRDGSDMKPETRVVFELNTRDFADFHGEVASATPMTVDDTFTDTLTLQLGRRAVRLVAPGRGNTAGDAYAYIPDVGVLLTGDLVTMPCPFPSTAYFADWIRGLDGLIATRAKVVVPGHGEPMRDFGYVSQVRELLSFTLKQANDAVSRGLTAEQFTEATTLADFLPTFAGSNVLRTDAFENFYRSAALPRAFLEATLARKGELAPPYPQ